MNPGLPFEWIAAVRFLREGRMQTLLIIVGVGIGVAVIVFMSALLLGLQSNIIRRTLSATSQIVVLPPEDVARPQRGADAGGAPDDGTASASIVQRQSQRLRSIDQWQSVIERLRAMPGVAVASPMASGPAFTVRGTANKAITILGIEPDQYQRIVTLPEKMALGEYRLTARDALIGTELAKDLGITVGDKLRVTTPIGRTDTFNVSGVFDLGNKGANQRTVYLSLRAAQTLLDLPGGASSIDVNAVEAFDAERIAQRISSETGLVADSWIKTNAQFFVALSAQTFSNTAIRFFVALSVAFGIASVLVVSVVQRSREVGILRAMGASRAQVMRVFLIQGGIVGFVGSLLGSLIAALFLVLWRVVARNPDGSQLFIISLDLSLLVWTSVLATVVGLLSAVAPARRAAYLDPVVAIRG
jgi:lipoprotein-releasing system permease protein